MRGKQVSFFLKFLENILPQALDRYLMIDDLEWLQQF